MKSIADQILHNRIICNPVKNKHKGLAKTVCFTHSDVHTFAFLQTLTAGLGGRGLRTGGEVWLRRGEAALIIWAALQ